MTRYVTVEELKSWLGSELQDRDAFYEGAIDSAELWIDDKFGRRMEVADPAATARSFRPSGCSRTLIINDCTEIDSVVENGVTLVVDVGYEAEPLNGLTAAGESWPYYKLVKPYLDWYTSANLASIVVTANWGWAAIPAQVYDTCLIVAKDYLLQADVAHGIIDISTVGGVGTRENRLVQDAVHKYAHPSTIGVS